MNNKRDSRSVPRSVTHSIRQRLTGPFTRLNQTNFVQNTCMYLNQRTFLARVASVGYSIWEWSKRKPTRRTECEQKDDPTKEEDSKKECDVEEKLINENTIKLVKMRRNDLMENAKEIKQLIKEERRKAIADEYQEALILELTGKDF